MPLFFQENAKRRKDKIWANYVEEEVKTTEVEDDKKDDGERKVNHQTVVITEVNDDAHVYAQHVDEGPKLEGLMDQLREEFTRNPPLAGAYTPRNGKIFEKYYVKTAYSIIFHFFRDFR